MINLTLSDENKSVTINGVEVGQFVTSMSVSKNDSGSEQPIVISGDIELMYPIGDEPSEFRYWPRFAPVVITTNELTWRLRVKIAQPLNLTANGWRQTIEVTCRLGSALPSREAVRLGAAPQSGTGIGGSGFSPGGGTPGFLGGASATNSTVSEAIFQALSIAGIGRDDRDLIGLPDAKLCAPIDVQAGTNFASLIAALVYGLGGYDIYCDPATEVIILTRYPVVGVKPPLLINRDYDNVVNVSSQRGQVFITPDEVVVSGVHFCGDGGAFGGSTGGVDDETDYPNPEGDEENGDSPGIVPPPGSETIPGLEQELGGGGANGGGGNTTKVNVVNQGDRSDVFGGGSGFVTINKINQRSSPTASMTMIKKSAGIVFGFSPTPPVGETPEEKQADLDAKINSVRTLSSDVITEYTQTLKVYSGGRLSFETRVTQCAAGAIANVVGLDETNFDRAYSKMANLRTRERTTIFYAYYGDGSQKAQSETTERSVLEGTTISAAAIVSSMNPFGTGTVVARKEIRQFARNGGGATETRALADPEQINTRSGRFLPNIPQAEYQQYGRGQNAQLIRDQFGGNPGRPSDFGGGGGGNDSPRLRRNINVTYPVTDAQFSSPTQRLPVVSTIPGQPNSLPATGEGINSLPTQPEQVINVAARIARIEYEKALSEREVYQFTHAVEGIQYPPYTAVMFEGRRLIVSGDAYAWDANGWQMAYNAKLQGELIDVLSLPPAPEPSAPFILTPEQVAANSVVVAPQPALAVVRGQLIPPVVIDARLGTPPYFYTLINAPSGIVLDGNTLRGTVPSAGTYPVTVLVTDSTGQEANLDFEIEVSQEPVYAPIYEIEIEDEVVFGLVITSKYYPYALSVELDSEEFALALVLEDEPIIFGEFFLPDPPDPVDPSLIIYDELQYKVLRLGRYGYPNPRSLRRH